MEKAVKKMSYSELLDALQKEYIVFKLRAEIYPKSHKEYWIGLCSKKQTKILSISKKSGLPNIFASDVVRNRYMDEVIPKYGLPMFKYRDNVQKDKIGNWDLINLFKEGRKFKYHYRSEERDCIVKNFLLEDMQLGFKMAGMKDVIFIYPEDFNNLCFSFDLWN